MFLVTGVTLDLLFTWYLVHQPKFVQEKLNSSLIWSFVFNNGGFHILFKCSGLFMNVYPKNKTLFIQGSNQEKVKVTIIAITFDGHPESVLAVVNDSVEDTNVGKGKEEDGSDVDDREEIPGVPEQFRSRPDIQK